MIINIWRVLGLFSNYDSVTGIDMIKAVQWECRCYDDDLTLEFPRSASLVGTYTFNQMIPNTSITSDENVFSYMESEGFSRSSVETQAVNMI